MIGITRYPMPNLLGLYEIPKILEGYSLAIVSLEKMGRLCFSYGVQALDNQATILLGFLLNMLALPASESLGLSVAY